MREEILEALSRLGLVKSESEINLMLADLKALAPHAHIHDLVFYGERERTNDEIADEALLRERIWSEGGDSAVWAHIEGLALATLSDPSISDLNYRKIDARLMLDNVRKHRAP
jgi:radical SAM superfamily enzyme YgiQ (UPF0313 family)